ncbi:MAG: redoxin domain-containing protein [Acidobacteriia bacterium]|nr:redoxin domain-containing protein [Terriglobia bacterium]
MLEPQIRLRRSPAACAFLNLLLTMAAAAQSSPLTGGQIGAKVADFRLTDNNGKSHTLEDYTGKILVLEFWSFKCPVSLAYDERVAALQSKYGGRGVSVLAVASNKNESSAEVKRNAENLKLAFPVLLDQDGMLAEKLGATHTPSVFILDGTGTLRYRGAIDNNKRATERGRIAYVEAALDALLAGQPVPQADTQVFGCSIKR